jgi:hypothetical protein
LSAGQTAKSGAAELKENIMTIRIISDIFGAETTTFASSDELARHVNWCAVELGWYNEYRRDAVEECEVNGVASPVSGEDYKSLEQFEADLLAKAIRESETVPSVNATVIFGNGGGVTVQLTNGSESWAHYYDNDLRAAAGDVHAALFSGTFDHYDGDEADAHECAPTAEEIRNGGYRVERFDTFAQYEDFCLSDHSESWGNIRELTGWVKCGEL